jgi:hypothetical protein
MPAASQASAGVGSTHRIAVPVVTIPRRGVPHGQQHQQGNRPGQSAHSTLHATGKDSEPNLSHGTDHVTSGPHQRPRRRVPRRCDALPGRVRRFASLRQTIAASVTPTANPTKTSGNTRAQLCGLRSPDGPQPRIVAGVSGRPLLLVVGVGAPCGGRRRSFESCGAQHEKAAEYRGFLASVGYCIAKMDGYLSTRRIS